MPAVEVLLELQVLDPLHILREVVKIKAFVVVPLPKLEAVSYFITDFLLPKVMVVMKRKV